MLLAGMLFAAVTITACDPPAPPPPPVSQPATQPATAPAAQPAPPPAGKWIDVVLREHPDFPTTQPLAFPVAFEEAARVEIESPIYLCPRGDLWITRSDAAPTPTVLKSAVGEQAHVVRDTVRYAHWAVTDAGSAYVTLVVQPSANTFDVVTATGRKPISAARDYRWDRAFSWNDRIVVPTSNGVSVIDPASGTDQFQGLLAPATTKPGVAAAPTPARVLLDRRGLIAWIPWSPGSGAGHVSRYVDGAWHQLQDGWPPRVIELLPLLDGTVTVLSYQVRVDSPPAPRLTSVVLDADGDAPIDEAAVEKLVAQLSDVEPARRESAMGELSRYGPRIWPILERLQPNQPVEARLRLEELLSARRSPTLGIIRPAADDLRVIAHLRDGGVVFYSESGVEVPRGGGEPRAVAPAWISVRPGRPATLLPDALVADASPDRTRLWAWGDEWIVSDDDAGPRRFMGNHTRPLLMMWEQRFSEFAGIDSRGRWLFRDPKAGRTLVIDRFLPDPTPRLPVWTIGVDEGEVGWTHDDWPVSKRGGSWALGEESWKPLPDDAVVLTEVEEPLSPATTQAIDRPILVEPDGARWFDGRQTLRRERGTEVIVWPLPAPATGSASPVLLRADGRLFLFNEPGRVLRIGETRDGASEPLAVEATFTRGIPNVDSPRRIWLDPAGRIVIAYDRNKLAILFPSGRVPPEIAKMMPAGDEP